MADGTGSVSSMPACVLAGGLGLRLRSVVPDGPKVLAPVGGRPFLDYVLALLARNGVRRVTVCTGYGSDAVEAFCGDGSRWGLDLSHSREERPLGTAGAVRQAWDRLADDTVLVLNGDTFFDVPLEQLARAHRTTGAAATLAVRPTDEPGRYGTVEVSDAGFVTAFREKVDGAAGLMNGGIYMLDRVVLDRVPANTQVSLEREVFPAMTGDDARHRVAATQFDGYFVDIGVPADHARANREAARLGATGGHRC